MRRLFGAYTSTATGSDGRLRLRTSSGEVLGFYRQIGDALQAKIRIHLMVDHGSGLGRAGDRDSKVLGLIRLWLR